MSNWVRRKSVEARLRSSVLPASLQPGVTHYRHPAPLAVAASAGDDRRALVREPRGRFKLTPQSCKLPVEAVERCGVQALSCHRAASADIAQLGRHPAIKVSSSSPV